MATTSPAIEGAGEQIGESQAPVVEFKTYGEARVYANEAEMRADITGDATEVSKEATQRFRPTADQFAAIARGVPTVHTGDVQTYDGYKIRDLAENTPMQIRRYEVIDAIDGGAMALRTDGDFVKYEDHVRAMLNPSGQRLTGNDAATFKLFQHLLDTIATAEQDPLFAGFRMEEMLSPDGLLLAVRLVACDAIGGIAAPRVV